MKYAIFVGLIVLIIASVIIYNNKPANVKVSQKQSTAQAKPKTPLNPLAVEVMRKRSYPGSAIIIEQTLGPGSNYTQYIVSYMSDGLKIYALLTVPDGAMPKGGWPVIIFNHGYIPPEIYRTTERYIAYVAALAQSGYIVFKPDFRGNGESQGQPEGAYYSPAYAIDDLNAISSIKKLKDPVTGKGLIANPNKIGVWGHSMGGNITLRDLVVDPKDIKVAVIWGGVVGSYNDLINNWHRAVPYQPSVRELALRNRYRSNLVQQYGTPQTDPAFWNSVDPTYFISSITAPIQLDHGLADEEVPVAFSQSLYEKLKAAGKTVEFYTYPGADHNISEPSFSLAMQRTIVFFDKYLK